MPVASGSYKQTRIKAQTAFGTIAGSSGGRIVSRTDSTADLNKQAFTNNRINSRLQPLENRHGVRSVSASIADHMSPGNSTDLLAGALKRAFVAVAPMTALSITIAAGSGGTWTLTRSAGSWITSGLRIGMGCRLTAGTFNAANSNKTLFVVGLTATIATVIVANGSALVAEGPIASATLTVPGKVNHAATASHVETVFTLEEWHPDMPFSKVFTDVRVNSTAINIPATGMCDITFALEGRNLAQKGASAYFTAPAAEALTPPGTGLSGVFLVGGAVVPVTGLQLTYGTPYSGEATLGSNTLDYRFAETPTLSGSATAYFDGSSLFDLFDSETPTAIDVLVATSSAAACEFMAFSLPYAKFDAAPASGGRGGLIHTYNFSASENPTVGAREATAFAVHDSLAP